MLAGNQLVILLCIVNLAFCNIGNVFDAIFLGLEDTYYGGDYSFMVIINIINIYIYKVFLERY